MNMVTHVRQALLALGCISTAGLLTLSSVAAAALPDTQNIDAYMNSRLDTSRIPGAAVAITHGSQTYVQGYGSAGNDRRVTADTQFLLASVSKSFTAVAVLQLVEDHQIELDQPVQRYLSEFALADGSAKQITVRQLLQQTSGLSDQSFALLNASQATTLQERLVEIRQARIVSKPGTAFHYTDINYQILARVVEVVSDQSFATYMQEHIFEPLDMLKTRTVTIRAEVDRVAPDLAQGHIIGFGAAVERPELQGFMAGSSGLISTAADMSHWLIMQSNGGRYKDKQIVSAANLQLMHTPSGVSPTTEYGMGWQYEAPRKGLPAQLTHTGVLGTFSSEQALVPSDGYGIVLMYNSSYSFAGNTDIRKGLVALLTGKEPPSQPLFSARVVGVLLLVLTILAMTLRVRTLANIRRSASAKQHEIIWWKTIPRLLWPLAPALLVAFLPAITTAFSGRVFTQQQLFYAMPDVIIWLGVSGILGVLISAWRAWNIVQAYRHLK